MSCHATPARPRERLCQTAAVATDESLTCSAKGCRAPARYALRWNNPKLHPPERRKTWLACPEHREHLAGFLGRRDFLREVDELPDSTGPLR